MKHIKLFEDERPIISYDFDGCLHTSVIGYDPINFIEPETWEPFEAMHKSLREDAKTHKIVIVTARPEITNPYVWEFVKMHNLPVEEIYATDNMPKTPLLKKLGVIRHYDDHVGLIQPLKDAGIEFVLTNPKTKTSKLIESLNEDTLKNFLISFINDKFYISDNTLNAFITQLRKIDPDLIHDPKHNGKGKDHKAIIVRSGKLTHEDITGLIKTFIQKYDWLKMNVVVTKYF